MSWQNWVVSWMTRNRVKRPTEREPFDPFATRRNAEIRTLPMPMRMPEDWRVVPANGSRVPGEWIEPADPDAIGDTPPVVLYLHGGGYFFCSPRTHRSITVGLAMHARARVYVPEYRLAPEHPFPAPVEDAVRWIVEDGGTAVLAHPAKYQFTHSKLRELIECFKEAGGSGLEVACGMQTPATTRQLAELCRRYDMSASAGSDFHGGPQDHARLGQPGPFPEDLTPVWSTWALS